MGRVAHQKSAKQANTSNGNRGNKVAKQRKNHQVVIESDSQEKGTNRAVLSFRADPPPGYTFIPAGNPQLTAALKEFAKRGNHQILAVTTTPHATRHELSREVHRIGFHFPTEVVAQVCNHYGIRLTSGGKLVEEKDDDQLFMRLYQKGQLVLDEEVRDQVTINTEAKQIIQDLFPNIPEKDLFQIIKTAFQLGDGKVGTADEIPLVRRAQLSVVAHIRHTYTSYDKLLRTVPYSEARHKVENITLQKLIEWRGDDDDKQAMEDTLREVVVISDEEFSDNEIEEGQLLETEHLRVRPVDTIARPKDVVDDRHRSPVEAFSEDDVSHRYRYLNPVVRRHPAQDSQALFVARQQSRYAVWDRMRQQYRGDAPSQSSRVVERVLLEEPSAAQSPKSYVTREPIYVSDAPSRRFIEPAARIVHQPSPPDYIRGADGKLYERIDQRPELVAAPVPIRRAYTPPPTEYNRQFIDSRQVSPRPPLPPPRLQRRTESLDNNDGTIMPSIEGPNGLQSSPAVRRNPFEESQPNLGRRNLGAYSTNHQAPIIDLTNEAEQASKRRRVDGTPPSPYLIRKLEYDAHDNARNGSTMDMPYQREENVRPPQQPHLIQLDNPVVNDRAQHQYERIDLRMQPTVVYREEIPSSAIASPRGAPSRHIPISNAREPYYHQSPRRMEYVNENDRSVARPYVEPVRHHISDPTVGVINGTSRMMLEEIPDSGQTMNRRVELEPRYIRPEPRTPFEISMQPQFPAQYRPTEHPQRDYATPLSLQYPPSHHNIRTSAQPAYDSARQLPRMALPPKTGYQDEHPVRTTYVQNQV